MGYLENYFARVNNFGNTPRDKATNIGIRDFDDMIQKSSFANDILLYGTNSSEHVLIYYKKESELKNEIYVSTYINSSFDSGTIFNWEDNYWISVFQDIMPIESHKRYHCYKCNIDLKWINSIGNYLNYPSCFIGSGSSFQGDKEQSVEDIIHNDQIKKSICITPALIDVDYSQRFIINDEAWKIVDIDKNTTNGVWFLSLQYDELNPQLDDITNSIAYHTPIDTIVSNNSIDGAVYTLLGNTNLRWGYTEDYSVIKSVSGVPTNFNCVVEAITNGFATYIANTNSSFSLTGDTTNMNLGTILINIYDDSIFITNFSIELIPYWL